MQELIDEHIRYPWMTGSANHQQLAALLDPGARQIQKGQIQMSDSPSPSSHPVTGSIIHSGQGVPIRDSFACFFSIGGGRLTPNKGKAHTQQINTKVSQFGVPTKSSICSAILDWR